MFTLSPPLVSAGISMPAEASQPSWTTISLPTRSSLDGQLHVLFCVHVNVCVCWGGGGNMVNFYELTTIICLYF